MREISSDPLRWYVFETYIKIVNKNPQDNGSLVNKKQ